MVRTNYLTLLIYLLQKGIVDNAKTVNVILSVIEFKKKDEQIISFWGKKPVYKAI